MVYDWLDQCLPARGSTELLSHSARSRGISNENFGTPRKILNISRNIAGAC